MKKSPNFIISLLIFFFIGFDVQAGTINTLPADGSMATSDSMAQGGTFVADDNFLSKFTISIGMSIPRTARPIILGTTGDGTPTTGPVLWEGPDVNTPEDNGELTFYPNLPITVGSLYFIGLDYGNFTSVNGDIILLGSKNGDPIPEGHAWRYFSSGWNPFSPGVDIAAYIEMIANPNDPNNGTVPCIMGEYSGTYTDVVSNCSDSGMNGTYNATLVMRIFTRTENTFGGVAIGTFTLDGLTAREYIQLSGTITESGQISGTTSHSFLGTRGEGTFTGQLSGNTLTIENPGHDTFGDTCTYIRYMSATREGNFSSPICFNEFKLSRSDAAAIDRFGNSVSISGGYAIVGAYEDDDNGLNSGSAYIFKRSENSWNQVAKLIAGDGAAGDMFGGSVSISGDTAIVGARLDDDNGTNSGSAYIFSRDQGGSDNWGMVNKLTASDGAAVDVFGISVSISGDTAIVGAYGDGDNVMSDYGSAYIFSRDQGGSDNWGMVNKLTASDRYGGDHFGISVSISGDSAIVGAYEDDANGLNSGSAYIFKRSENSWNQVAKLIAGDGAAGDMFGGSVSISGDTAIVGAHDPYGTYSNSVYIFTRDWGGADNWGEVKKLTAGGYFGCSVSISGDTAIVGAYDDDDNFLGISRVGSAYTFSRDQGGSDNWGMVNKLTPNEEAYYDNYGYKLYIKFGYSVSISGDTAIVGAYGGYDKEARSGSAYIFNLFPPNNLAHAIIALQVPTAGNPADISDLADINNDGLIGLEEVIFALQAAAGLR